MRGIIPALLLTVLLAGCTIRDGKIFFDGQTTNPTTEDGKTKPAKEKQVRFLIVEESEDRPTLSGPQAAIFRSIALRDYLGSHCCKGPDGKTPEFRFLDKDDDVSRESPTMQATFKRDRSRLPYFYVTDGTKGTEGPLPEDEDRLMMMIKPFME